MDWSALLNTALGGLLAISGGIAGALFAERRADAREQREREHEREVWARGLRHEAHVAFLSLVDERYRALSEAKELLGDEPPEDFLDPVWDRYEALRLVCTKDTSAEAEELLTDLRKYAFGDGQWQAVDYQRDRYLGEVRREFGLPPIPLMGDREGSYE